MTQEKAEKHINFLKKYCKENGLWSKDYAVCNPVTSEMGITITVKVK